MGLVPQFLQFLQNPFLLVSGLSLNRKRPRSMSTLHKAEPRSNINSYAIYDF